MCGGEDAGDELTGRQERIGRLRETGRHMQSISYKPNAQAVRDGNGLSSVASVNWQVQRR